jgi:hypothetical protein
MNQTGEFDKFSEEEKKSFRCISTPLPAAVDVECGGLPPLVPDKLACSRRKQDHLSSTGSKLPSLSAVASHRTPHRAPIFMVESRYVQGFLDLQTECPPELLSSPENHLKTLKATGQQ